MVTGTGAAVLLPGNGQEGNSERELAGLLMHHETAALLASGFTVFVSLPLCWNISVPDLE